MACIRKRRGRYVIDFYDQHGKRRWKTLPAGATKKEAKDELRTLEDLIAKGVYLPIKKMPLFSEVARDWIEYKRPNLRETTWEVYEGHVRNHFTDLEDLKINRITTVTIEKYITTRQNQGMNILTLRKILITLGQIMSYAVRHKYIDHNPVRDAERPRDQRKKVKKIRILTPVQIQAFLGKVEEQKYQTLFKLAIMSGARQGELLGLQWSDLDMVNSQIHIQRTFTKGRFFTTKTRTSNRKIDLGPVMMTELKKWKLMSRKNKLD
ncbi:MAG: tyrosine-type recombinase/integrase, partial [Candidatus Hodarchaeota archaeon]